MPVQLRAVDDDVLGDEVVVRRTPFGVSLILHNPKYLPAEDAVYAALDLPLLTADECDYLDSFDPDLPH